MKSRAHYENLYQVIVQNILFFIRQAGLVNFFICFNFEEYFLYFDDKQTRILPVPENLAFPVYSIKTHKPWLSVIFHDDIPFSFVDENRRIQGVDGKFINEFLRISGLNYSIFNKNSKLYTVPAVGAIDFSLSRYFRMDLNMTGVLYEDVWLFDSDGFCMLVPRNILVGRMEALTSPFGFFISLLIGISGICVVLLWKLFKRLQKENNVGFLDICFYMLRIFIGKNFFAHF
jgi:hypothetical protein